jgi:hypothetical protein
LSQQCADQDGANKNRSQNEWHHASRSELLNELLNSKQRQVLCGTRKRQISAS